MAKEFTIIGCQTEGFKDKLFAGNERYFSEGTIKLPQDIICETVPDKDTIISHRILNYIGNTDESLKLCIDTKIRTGNETKLDLSIETIQLALEIIAIRLSIRALLEAGKLNLNSKNDRKKIKKLLTSSNPNESLRTLATSYPGLSVYEVSVS
ncbi:hypothetical protein A2335_00905 [Candidatus Peregrinibacteria bacterium RIFOXYB2_FULL_32_7]|nr:MAG: hypothetical protein A2335_00905 [Candidatus Peregrinibacteria bacterium RIFOXYB2_FULL_32_7]